VEQSYNTYRYDGVAPFGQGGEHIPSEQQLLQQQQRAQNQDVKPQSISMSCQQSPYMTFTPRLKTHLFPSAAALLRMLIQNVYAIWLILESINLNELSSHRVQHPYPKGPFPALLVLVQSDAVIELSYVLRCNC
jgi:hypothetical protein